jgi:hypothetical protein
MDAPSLTAAVRRELLAHPEVTEGTHRFGGIVFYLGRHELGHLHGETIADLPFPPHIRDELVASGRVSPDHVVSDSAWVSRRVDGPADVAEIVELFRISYEHAAAQAALAGSREEHRETVPDADRPPKATWRNVVALPSRRILRRRSRRR